MIKNYGLVIETEKDPNAYMLGALAKEVLQPSGQWDEFLTSEEKQTTRNSTDTFGCTVFGSLNAKEILLKRLEGKEYDFSERYPYNLAEINPPGADPHIVAEKIRHHGSIGQEELPMTKTLKDFASPRPMTKKYLDKGQEFPYELRHEFIFYRTDSQATKIKKIKEALKYSPVCLSVTAWHEENGVYVDKGQPNTHWVVFYGWSDKGWKCLDSYPPYKKIVSFDHQFEIGKVYQLVKKTDIVEAQFTLIGYLVEMVNLLLKKYLTTTPKEPEPIPEPPAVEEPKKDYITIFAKAIQDFEGWKPGSKSYRNNNPGNIKNTKGQFIKYASYEQGFNALKDYIQRACTGKHKAYKPDFTIKDFIKTYAPDGEPIVTNYSNAIAKKLELPVTTKLKDLV